MASSARSFWRFSLLRGLNTRRSGGAALAGNLGELAQGGVFALGVGELAQGGVFALGNALVNGSCKYVHSGFVHFPL